jgi:DNA polymerase-4
MATAVPANRARIMHVDMDAFFASVEQSVNPHLQGRPVLVGGENGRRGVVAAASYESRAFGIHSAMNMAEARRLCPDAVLVDVDGEHYGYVSKEVYRIFRRFSPRVDMLSVDEAFLDITGCDHLHGGEESLALNLKSEIRGTVGLTCSIGIAPNRSLAKIVSSVYKPDGLMAICAEDIPHVIHPLRVGQFSGIGPVTEKNLHKVGITTLGELATASVERLSRVFRDRGERMQRILWGGEGAPVLPPDLQPFEKSMGHEVTLSQNTHDQIALEAMLSTLCDRVARRLREHQFVGRRVTLRVRYDDFETHTRQMTLPHHSDRSRQFFTVARRLLHTSLNDPRSVRLIGVSVSLLVPIQGSAIQRDLFADPGRERRDQRLEHVWDSIRDRYGEMAMTRGINELRAR